ncbi:activator of 90 kDa heat shock protein ATPase homolog 1-like [Carassius auratus]|uniref:Activator of 90 kDa heat shock protein ATPase homolog 1 n=1 Tax=Carassius auratus TaxID=7957 RepID=A0A6P6R7Z7_CARAU|nr:activator of 90 kDa heat shock protein ATPase homolog 1-like [Carassius auratus]XP_052436976.1 activator of 90 kDa heat shock protein ATPase homolog 1-like [Carassius gibelio]
MAKWGEGDPRWIVEERADATNVNNWHWTERDATNWSSEKLKELLMGLQVESEEGKCEITEVSKLEGEASINNRKGKLIFFYEWNLKADWRGTSKSGIKYKGNIEVPNLSDENDMDDLDISVSLCKDEPETELLSLMRSEGVKKIRTALASYVDFLKTEFTQGMILPTANGVTKQQTAQALTKSNKTQIGSCSAAPPPPNTGVKIPTCKFSLKETFLTSPEDLYRVFLNQEMVQAFTRSSALVEAEKGGKFRLLDGNVNGEFQELVPEQKIVMKWRFNSWPCEHYAMVTLTFTDKGNETELKIECRAVPESEEERTRDGWQRYYCHAIKQTFGYGARLY